MTSVDKRVLILQNARKLFLEQGYKSTSIQSIATESGISKGAIYLYFSSKDEILLAIFRMIEEKVWTEIERINQNLSLSAKEKYRQQIITFYNEILENLQFNQMMLSESGVELSEAFYNYAREYRYKLQIVQEQSIINIYGEDLRPWIGDIVISINGVMQEFDASIVLDGLKLVSENLAEYICEVTDILVLGVLKRKPAQLFKQENKKTREEFLKKIKQDKKDAVSELFSSIVEKAEKLKLSIEKKDSLDETLKLLKDALETKNLNKTLLKALLFNLVEFSQLKNLRLQLLELLDIRV